jgi:hypothetical protein
MADVVMVVNNGLGIVTSRIKGTGTEPARVHWGTGTTAPVGTNTGLGTARAESKVAGTTTQQTTTTTNDTYRVVGTLTCAGTAAAITEAGLFDTGDVLFLRGTFDAINLNVGDTITFTINTVFARP